MHIDWRHNKNPKVENTSMCRIIKKGFHINILNLFYFLLDKEEDNGHEKTVLTE